MAATTPVLVIGLVATATMTHALRSAEHIRSEELLDREVGG